MNTRNSGKQKLKPVDSIENKVQDILPALLQNLNMEDFNAIKGLSFDDFSRILKEGGEKERISLLDHIENKVLTPEDTFFFYVSETQYELHRKDRVRQENEVGDQFFEMGKHTYVAPLSLYRLFNNRKKGNRLKGPMKYSNMQVTIGNGSNIQELRAVNCNRSDKKIRINIGDNTSMAHNVGFKVEDTSDKEAIFSIGSKVFIGINSTLEDGLNIESGTNGNYTTIGFGSHLKKGCTIGSGCIIGDGATIDEYVTLPPNVVVLPGIKIAKENIGNQTTMKEFVGFKKDKQQTFSGLVHLQDEEDRKELKELGPALAFLNRFNDHVLEDNHTFPTMYRFIKKFHGNEHIETLERNGGHFVNIDLPKEKKQFLYHYYQESLKFQEAQLQGKSYDIKLYEGDFTNLEIDDTVKMAPGAIMYNIGETKIKGDTRIDGLVVNRSGDEGGSLVIDNSDINHGVVFHAKGSKQIENSVLGRRTIIHGESSVKGMSVGENVMIHNSNIDGIESKEAKAIDFGSTVVGANIINSSIGSQTRILGYAGDPISVVNSYIPNKCVIRDGSTITNSTSIEPGTTTFSGSTIIN